MSLTQGTRLASYEIIGPLGAGGMGEVYRARDTKLNRDVAIKVLPELFAADRERLARFEREAQSLAALNHSNIAQIFGLIDSPSALVMELVDGEDLAERLARGPIALDEALPIARQIAEALEAAHERGIIHRDLKPANIKVTPEGVVKVLDFGLAKALAADSSVRPAGDLLNSPTFTSPAMTEMGVILGTAAYMSPEQAKGKTADKRADIWAFGVVLHEMLTGTRLFACDTPSETVAAVLRADVDLRALPTAIPTSVRRLLERCLERDPRLRLRDIGEARIALTGPFASEPAAPMAAARRQAAAAWALAGIAAGAAGVWLIAGATMRQPDSRRETSEPVMFSVPPPSGGAFAINVEWTAIAVSPDGSQLAFTARPRGSPQSSVWVRPLSAVDARQIPGTNDATSIFWAPDGKSIGFFASGKMKRIDLTGGAPVTICDVREGIGQTGTWGIDGQILFASVQGEAIMRVPASGGAQVEVIKPDPARKERRVSWPSLLPDGRRFVYLVGLDDDSGAIMLGGQDGTAREILRVKSAAQYVDPGYLVFAHDSTLIARRFDAATGTLSGDPIAIADRVNHFLSTGAAQFSASRNGVIAYLPHRDESHIAAFDRSGRELAEARPRGGYQSLRVVARGRELLFARVDPRTTTLDVWRLELDRGVETRLTNDPGSELLALLDGDGNMIYSAARGGAPRLYRRNLATAVDELLVTDMPGMQMVSDLSPDGRWLLYSQRSARGNFDLHALSLSDRRVVPLRRSPADEEGGHFSRDGEYVAFTSDESGRREVYLTAFQPPGAPRAVSTGGGVAPRWSADGRELFYLSAGQIMSVPVRVARPLEIGKASVLFALPSSLPWTDFDVTPDGRFIAIVPLQYAAAQPLTVIVDWPSLANRKD